MTYSIEPEVTRVTPFHTEGGALAAIEISFGPISVNTKLRKNDSGHFLTLPSRKSEARDKWYDLVAISDRGLLKRALTQAVIEYEKHMREGELVAVG